MGNSGRVFVLVGMLWAFAREGAATPVSPAPTASASPPATQPNPSVAAPTALEALRISGEKFIVPDDVDKVELSRAGKFKVVTTYKICIDTNGALTLVEMLKGTGLPSYDAKIQAEMKQWRYRPYTVDGVAKPVCTSVTFIYTQGNEGPSPTPLRPRGRKALFGGRQLTSPRGVVIPVADATLASVRLSPDYEPANAAAVPLRFSSLDARYGVELLASPGDLSTVAQVPLMLADTDTPTSAEVDSLIPGCRLRRGAPVRVLQSESEGSRLRVTTASGSSQVSGWVWALYVGKSFADGEDPVFLGDWVALPKGTKLLDSPKGKPLRAAADTVFPGHALVVKRVAGHALVKVEDVSWWCLGWVPAAGLVSSAAQAPPALPVRAPKAERTPPTRRMLTVPRATQLLDLPGGKPVGVVLEPHDAPVLGNQDGHSQLEIQTAVGVLRLWVALTP